MQLTSAYDLARDSIDIASRLVGSFGPTPADEAEVLARLFSLAEAIRSELAEQGGGLAD
jgi:hypothetical protein